jgi:hypothetical protein
VLYWCTRIAKGTLGDQGRAEYAMSLSNYPANTEDACVYELPRPPGTITATQTAGSAPLPRDFLSCKATSARGPHTGDGSTHRRNAWNQLLASPSSPNLSICSKESREKWIFFWQEEANNGCYAALFIICSLDMTFMTFMMGFDNSMRTHQSEAVIL